MATVTATATASVILYCKRDCFNQTIDYLTSYLRFKLVSILPADNPSFATVTGFGINIKLVQKDTNNDCTIRIEYESIQDVVLSDVGIDTRVIHYFSVPNGSVIECVRVEHEVLPELVPEWAISIANNSGNGGNCNSDRNSNSSSSSDYNSSSSNKDSDSVGNSYESGSDSEGDTTWTVGRAGMQYRDLIPNRLGGRVIASHIRIPIGGPVPDYVHYHKIRFQMIYCYKGWVDVVYEDQGPPFRLFPGDCVLQPPLIRHRVLESSDQLEVIEISSPAVHETFREYEIQLTTATCNPSRLFCDQQLLRFVNSVAIAEKCSSNWLTITNGEILDTDLGFVKATNELVDARTWSVGNRPTDINCTVEMVHSVKHNAELFFLFILEGTCELIYTIETVEKRCTLTIASSVTIPANSAFTLKNLSMDLKVLQVTLPATSEIIAV